MKIIFKNLLFYNILIIVHFEKKLQNADEDKTIELNFSQDMTVAVKDRNNKHTSRR